jgi:predicted nucleic acid-binding OB-fold protein
MNTIYTSESIYKQFLINQFHNQLIQTNKTMKTQSNINPKPNLNIKPDLPKELCDIIKSYCFYDKISYQILCNTIQYKVDICDIINEHVINNEQLFIDYLDEEEATDFYLHYTTIIYTIQKYNPTQHTFNFSINNIINICLKCGNYVSCTTHNNNHIPRRIRCTC